MLKLGEADFTVGRSRFSDIIAGDREATAKIYVKIQHEALGIFLAQLDTGSPWSILQREIAEAVNAFETPGAPVSLETRHGRLEGRLVRIPVTITADEGQALDVEGTFWVSEEWPGGNFLGYVGLLDHIRIALDPAENLFYFGPCR